MMNNVKSLLITLHEPARIFLSQKEYEGGRLILDNKALSIPNPPWWATVADLLVNSTSNEFIGITYYVGESGKEIVQFLIDTLSPRVVRHVNSSSHENAIPYIKRDLKPDHFEIRWSLSEPDEIEVANLSCDYWYYDRISDEETKFMALGLQGVDEILLDYDLDFPAINHLELFEAKFKEINGK